jgi:hypothetical protein
MLNGIKNGYGKYYERLKPFYVIKDQGDSTLIFESRFESGNLRRAI